MQADKNQGGLEKEMEKIKPKNSPKLHNELQPEGELESWFSWMTAQQDTLH